MMSNHSYAGAESKNPSAPPIAATGPGAAAGGIYCPECS